jgi:hypothetical protein
MECERDVELRVIKADLYWPALFSHWQYNEKCGSFPNILPGDLNWTSVVPADPTCRETATWPQEGTTLAPVLVSLQTQSPNWALSWANSDYVVGSRVLEAASHMPDAATSFPAGRHELMTLTVDLGMTPEQMREHVTAWERERTVTAGLFRARFETGKLRLTYAGQELSAFLHFYASMLIGNLWNDSIHLQWHSHKREGDALLISGESRRFPYAQHWEIKPVEGGIGIRILLEVREPMDVTEYHASVVLRSDYSHWETPHETGPYPAFERDHEDWRHANRVYAVGKYAKALSSSLPSVMLSVTTDEVPFRMTAINTGYHENARVLQALRTPEAGLLHFEKGTYPYFAGVISVEPNETDTVIEGATATAT